MHLKVPLKHRIACKILEWTQQLSLTSAWRLSRLLAISLFPLKGRLQTTIRQNIAKVYPDKSPQARQQLGQTAFRHTIAFGLEAGSVWLKPLEYGQQHIVAIHGLHYFEEALKSQDGLLILLPHLGNWEMANQFIAPRAQVVALYKPHPNAQLEHYIYTARCRAGVQMVPTNRRGVSQILRHLKNGGVTVVLPDQVPHPTNNASGGVCVPFFGHDASTQTLAPKLAKSSGAQILGLVCARNNQGQFEVHISPAPKTIADPDIITAATAMNAYIEKLVNQFPAQYQWSYKRFK